MEREHGDCVGLACEDVIGKPSPAPRMATTAAEVTVLEGKYAHLRKLSTKVRVLAFPWIVSVPKSTDRSTRIVNVFVAALGLVLASPLFLLIGIAIKLTSRGPVFYKQTRVGLDRRWNRQSSHENL